MSSLVRPAIALLRAPATEFCFALRASVRWSRGAPRRDTLASAPTFAWAPEPIRASLQRRADALDASFHVAARIRDLAPEVRARNYARLEQLERLSRGMRIPSSAGGLTRAADLGAGDFYYAGALACWLSTARTVGGPRVDLRAFELDGHGIYRDGHARCDHGRAHAAAASCEHVDVGYTVADATRICLKDLDVVSLFFPFLTTYACIEWGAPLSRSRPKKMLAAAVRALRPGGWLVVANQTTEEFVRTQRLLQRLPVTRIARCSFASDLAPEAPRTAGQIGSVWQRHEGVPSGALIG